MRGWGVFATSAAIIILEDNNCSLAFKVCGRTPAAVSYGPYALVFRHIGGG